MILMKSYKTSEIEEITRPKHSQSNVKIVVAIRKYTNQPFDDCALHEVEISFDYNKI